MIKLTDANSTEELDAARHLMRLLVTWQKSRHRKDWNKIARHFDEEMFEAELAKLPGEFAPPYGALILAYEGLDPVGCVALRDLGDGVCEMTRMFVREDSQGRGVGLALAEAIITRGKALGYQTMRLSVGPAQDEAQGLYSRLGFVPIGPYYDLSQEMRDWMLFMELDLTA